VKLLRFLSRIALLSLAAAAFTGLTRTYGDSVRLPLPDLRWRAWRDHRASAPQVSGFPEFIGEGAVLAIFAVAGRTVFRLRLSPVSRRQGKPILLNLHRG
jgi:hypothetical protein